MFILGFEFSSLHDIIYSLGVSVILETGDFDSTPPHCLWADASKPGASSSKRGTFLLLGGKSTFGGKLYFLGEKSTFQFWPFQK